MRVRKTAMMSTGGMAAVKRERDQQDHEVFSDLLKAARKTESPLKRQLIVNSARSLLTAIEHLEDVEDAANVCVEITVKNVLPIKAIEVMSEEDDDNYEKLKAYEDEVARMDRVTVDLNARRDQLVSKLKQCATTPLRRIILADRLPSLQAMYRAAYDNADRAAVTAQMQQLLSEFTQGEEFYGTKK